MTWLVTQRVVLLAAGLVPFTVTMLAAQPAFSSGIARRDAVRVEEQHQQDAITCAQDAVAHGKQGHTEAIVSNADAALQHAMKANKGPYVEAAIAELKNAIEHGKAGYADVATNHADAAVTHLSEK